MSCLVSYFKGHVKLLLKTTVFVSVHHNIISEPQGNKAQNDFKNDMTPVKNDKFQSSLFTVLEYSEVCSCSG